jgi:hypothetical protein
MQLSEGALVQHKKHDPAQGKWHQYKIICTTAVQNIGADDLACLFSAMHTETNEVWEVCGNGGPLHYLYHLGRKEWATEPFVIYWNVLETYRTWPWARPLAMFLEPGRFTPITPQQIDRPH